MKRIVVVGGGVSGLAAAWSAWEEAGGCDGEAGVEIVLLEAADEVGGKALTLRRGPWQMEAGPSGFLDNEPVLDRLAELAGIEKLPAEEASARRYLVRKGSLREIRAHPLRFATSGILSPGALLRVACEPWIARREAEEDESVWEFARRRLGAQAADRLIAPMVLGIFAGDARRISLPSAFPRMAELESKYSSLFRAMWALGKEKRKNGRPTGGPGGPSGHLTSFREGMQSLPRELARRAPFQVRTGTPVRSIERHGAPARWRIEVDGGPLAADSLVLACDAPAAARLVREVCPPVARTLDQLSLPGLAVVGLGYGAEALARAPHGFGALISRAEGFRILGVLWESRIFPGRSPTEGLLMRAMIGGSTDPEAAALEPEELTCIARDDIARLIGLREPPTFEEVVRWPEAIPQYELGHAGRVAAVEAALEELRRSGPALHLAGNFLHGIAFPKAAAAGWSAGREAVRSLTASEPAPPVSPLARSGQDVG